MNLDNVLDYALAFDWTDLFDQKTKTIGYSKPNSLTMVY